MCPMCVTTAIALAAGTGATGGLAGLLLGKYRRGRRSEPPAQAPQPQENRT